MRYDWAGETPWCQKFTCKNSLLPPLFSSVFTVSPPPALSSCIMPPHLFTLLSLFSPSHHLPSSPSLSFCVSYHPALLHLHCGAALTIRTLHTYTEARKHTHTYRLTHTQGDTRPPLPAAPPLPLSHLSTADTKHSTTPGVPVLHQETLLALHQNSILHSHTKWLIVYTSNKLA